MLEKGKTYPFEAVLEELKRMYLEKGDQAWYEDEGWCVYVRESDMDAMDLDTECYIDEYPDVTDDDEEVLPPFVLEQGYELVYSDELLQDVVAAALCKKRDVTNEELMEAVDYYDCYDTFMEF